jgi:hypothetical protein
MSPDKEWRSISEYQKDLWDSEEVIFRDSQGTEVAGSYGYEDGSYDSETGDEVLWGAFHDTNGDPLGIEPVEWRPRDTEAAP